MLKPTFKKYAILTLALAAGPAAAGQPSLRWDNSVPFLIPGTDKPLAGPSASDWHYDASGPAPTLTWSNDPPPFMVPGTATALSDHKPVSPLAAGGRR